jgi:hypothetical protein
MVRAGVDAGLLFIAAKDEAKKSHAMKGRPGGEALHASVAVVLAVIVSEAGINEASEWLKSTTLARAYKSLMAFLGDSRGWT